jgi:hypothetical protein
LYNGIRFSVSFAILYVSSRAIILQH